MSETANLKLPLVAAAQAQKHVTVNEAIGALDALVQLCVLDRDRASPPADAVEGSRYIVAAGAAGEWAGRAGHVAVWEGGAWRFHAPGAGWLAFVLDERRLVAWEGAAWVDALAAVSAVQNLALLGIGTEADAQNPLAAKINQTLFAARRVGEGGNGDMVFKADKEAAGDDAGFYFSVGYALRAMFGLLANNDLTFKTSADGSTFHEGLVIRAASGIPAMPRLPKFIARLNFDQYVGANTWAILSINQADSNDQNVFDGNTGRNRFVAPVAGLYQIGGSIGWKMNGTNVPTALWGRFVRNGVVIPAYSDATRAGGTPAELGQNRRIWRDTIMLQLDANDHVQMQGLLEGLDGYFAKDVTGMWGHLIA